MRVYVTRGGRYSKYADQPENHLVLDPTHARELFAYLDAAANTQAETITHMRPVPYGGHQPCDCAMEGYL